MRGVRQSRQMLQMRRVSRVHIACAEVAACARLLVRRLRDYVDHVIGWAGSVMCVTTVLHNRSRGFGASDRQNRSCVFHMFDSGLGIPFVTAN